MGKDAASQGLVDAIGGISRAVTRANKRLVYSSDLFQLAAAADVLSLMSFFCCYGLLLVCMDNDLFIWLLQLIVLLLSCFLAVW
ncbi:hypothetical protein LOK49_LG02G01063 [Camellia lanceoleosa]|uniref:Uncharacterized protein n=1 Tax=Camellia lanceoleosa TaxID=1840588 RepID=A0ACC0IHA9_9ERIC|nr:hypothetical protein LOK49_LG02G01063 [Camellia lanceoleosa]